MILQKLKETTRPQHDELETIVNVMEQMFTMEDYRRLIGTFHKFYKAYEPAVPIDALREFGFDYDSRRKLPSLEADAAALGIAPSSDFDGVPDLSSAAKAFGSLYVIEGSTLGGQVITRHLKQHLDITPENGGAFFNSYGPMVGPMWKQFGEAITAFAAQAEADDEIVASAVDTFESIKNVFKENAAAVSSNGN